MKKITQGLFHSVELRNRIMEQFTKRLVLLVLMALLALVGGLLTFPPDLARMVVSKGGPWVMAATFVAFVVSIFRLLRSEKSLGSVPDLARTLWLDVLLVVLCSTLLLVHEPKTFKVLSDEVVLLNTSRSLHLEREFFTPVRAHNVSGNLVQMGGIIDKRPFFFAFVVSLVHDLTGYRPGNIFVVNGVTVVLLLILAASFGRKLGGPWSGRLAVLLMTSVPLIAQNATGAGFDLFNIMMVLAVMLLATCYMEERSAHTLNALVFGTILLAQTRYESILYVIPVGGIILGTWIRDRQLKITWPVMLAPLPLMMYLLQNRAFRSQPAFWQLPKGLESPFSPDFVSDNIGHAVAFMFNANSNLPNSLAISTFGLFAVGFLFLMAIRKRGFLVKSRPEVLVLVLFGLVIIFNMVLLMFYHWGQLDQFEVWRLSLPFYLLMVLAIVVVLPGFSQKPAVSRVACCLAAVLIYAHGIPTSAKAAATRTALPTNETAWHAEFLERHAGEDVLILSRSPVLPIVFGFPATGLFTARDYPENLEYHLRIRTYSDVFVFQRFMVGTESASVTAAEGFELGDNFEVETVAERSFSPFSLSRISRIVAAKAKVGKSEGVWENAQPGCDTKDCDASEVSTGDASAPTLSTLPNEQSSGQEHDPLVKYFEALP